MRDDGPDRDDFTLPAAGGPFDEEGLDNPNCPSCLHRMEVAGTSDAPYWACPHCGQALIV